LSLAAISNTESIVFTNLKAEKHRQQVAVSTEDKLNIKTIKNKRITLRLINQTLERAAVDAVNKDSILNSNMKQCSKCCMFFTSSYYFLRHTEACVTLDKPKHFVTQVIELAKESITYDSITITQNQIFQMRSEQQAFEQFPLSAVKKRGTNQKRTCKQLQFIISCMEIGEKDKSHKMSAEFARRLMIALGTDKGNELCQQIDEKFRSPVRNCIVLRVQILSMTIRL
jgi:Cu2+-containing amine oxidase